MAKIDAKLHEQSFRDGQLGLIDATSIQLLSFKGRSHSFLDDVCFWHGGDIAAVSSDVGFRPFIGRQSEGT